MQALEDAPDSKFETIDALPWIDTLLDEDNVVRAKVLKQVQEEGLNSLEKPNLESLEHLEEPKKTTISFSTDKRILLENQRLQNVNLQLLKRFGTSQHKLFNNLFQGLVEKQEMHFKDISTETKQTMKKRKIYQLNAEIELNEMKSYHHDLKRKIKRLTDEIKIIDSK